MIIAVIFSLHPIFLIYIFIKKLRTESLSSAFLNSSLIIIVFSIGWPICTTVTNLFFNTEGLGEYFDRDTITLLLLTILEFFFYRFYYKDLFVIGDGKEK